MLKPVRMNLVQVIVLQRDVPAVTEVLGRLHLLHPVDVCDVADADLNLTSYCRTEFCGLLTADERKVRTLMHSLGIDESEGRYRYEGGFYVDPRRIHREASELIDSIEPKLGETLDRIRHLEDQVREEPLIVNQLERLLPLDISLDRLCDLQYIHITVGRIPARNIDRLEHSLSDTPHFVITYRRDGKYVNVLAATLKCYASNLDSTLKSAYFTPIDLPADITGTPGEVLSAARVRARRTQLDLEREQAELELVKDRWAAELQRALYLIRVNLNALHLEERFACTGMTSILAGFVPEARADELVKQVRSVTDNRAVVLVEPAVDSTEESGSTVPTLLSNPRLLKPFEDLLRTYGVPRYNELDPTIFLALTYVVLFGFMFADLGQGAVLVFLGLLAATSGLPLFGRLPRGGVFVAACGLMASIFGLFFGSVFGYEDLLPALWMSPLHNPEVFLTAGLVCGVGMVSLSLVLNLVNRFRSRDLKEAFFGEHGLTSGLFYWTVLGGVLLFISGWQVPAMIAFAAGGAFLVLMVVGELYWDRSESQGTGGPLVALLGVFDLVLSYLTNSISFVRMAAFALAHAALGVAVHTVAGQLADVAAGPVLSVLVIIIGNAGIILLEGLIVGIQSMRLEFYEFFSRFFSGEGQVYKPVKLDEIQAGER